MFHTLYRTLTVRVCSVLCIYSTLPFSVRVVLYSGQYPATGGCSVHCTVCTYLATGGCSVHCTVCTCLATGGLFCTCTVQYVRAWPLGVVLYTVQYVRTWPLGVVLYTYCTVCTCPATGEVVLYTVPTGVLLCAFDTQI